MNKVCVKGQRIYFYRPPEPIPKSQVNFSKIEFDMDETWSSFLSVVAQFIQNGEAKNVKLEDGYCFVPSDLEIGAFELCLRGDDGESVVASVNRLSFEVCEGFDPSGETPLPPSPDLYSKLVAKVQIEADTAKASAETAKTGAENAQLQAEHAVTSAEQAVEAAKQSEKAQAASEQFAKDSYAARHGAVEALSNAQTASSEAQQSAMSAAESAAVYDYVVADVNQLKDDLAAEQTAREQANASLQQDISGKLPKSPADWGPWTADEQATARERIGASKKLGIWEDIATAKITEEAAAITVNLDANGNTFSLSDIICEITIPVENPVKQRSIYFGLDTLTSFTFSRTALTTNANYISGAITYARIVSGRVICDGAISGPANTRHQPYNKYAVFNGYGGIEAESFDSVSIFTYSDAFPAGTTVILKGIRT